MARWTIRFLRGISTEPTEEDPAIELNVPGDHRAAAMSAGWETTLKRRKQVAISGGSRPERFILYMDGRAVETSTFDRP